MNKAARLIESVSRLKLNKIVESAITKDEPIFDQINQLGVIEDFIKAYDLEKTVNPKSFKADMGYASRGSIYLNVPVDVKSIGPMQLIIDELTLQIQISKFDKVGPKGEQYAVQGSFKYVHARNSGSNGFTIPGRWYLTNEGQLIAGKE